MDSEDQVVPGPGNVSPATEARMRAEGSLPPAPAPENVPVEPQAEEPVAPVEGEGQVGEEGSAQDAAPQEPAPENAPDALDEEAEARQKVAEQGAGGDNLGESDEEAQADQVL